MKIPFRGLVLWMGVWVASTGCVPIRQYLPSDYGLGALPSSNSATQFENPKDFMNLGPDAWKNEMVGTASWYGLGFNGQLTSSGEIYNMNAMTAAHKTLPLGTIVKVDDLNNGKSVLVRINDRGPYVLGRIIDLSKAAAESLDMLGTGTAPVSLEIVKWPDPPK